MLGYLIAVNTKGPMWTLVIDGQYRNGTFTMKLNNDIMATPKQQCRKMFDTTSMAQCKTAVTPLLKHSEFLQSCTEPSLAVMFLFVFCIVDVNYNSVTATSSCSSNTVHHEIYPDSKVRGANIGPTWGRQDQGRPTGQGGSYVGPWTLQSGYTNGSHFYVFL